MKREDLYGIEFDWFAVDKANYIAHFSTAGYGPVPPQVIENIAEQDELLAYFKDRPGSFAARLIVHEEGKFDDWFEMAKHGLFTYDFKPWDGPYRLIAQPEKPATIESFPLAIQNILGRICFETICFEDAITISPEEFFFRATE